VTNKNYDHTSVNADLQQDKTGKLEGKYKAAIAY